MYARPVCNRGQICKSPNEMLALHLTWIYKDRLNVLIAMRTMNSISNYEHFAEHAR
jgi:hypothetical protein